MMILWNLLENKCAAVLLTIGFMDE